MSLNKIRKIRISKLAQEISAQIEVELGLPVGNREGRISDKMLQQILRLVSELKANVDEDCIPKKQLRHSSLQRIIDDSWPLGTGIGKKIYELEELYLTLD